MKKEESEQKKQKFLQLRVLENKSYDTISRELKISKQTCINWSVELKNILINLQSAKYDSLIEELDLSLFNRVKYLGNLYKKIEAELEKREFSNLATTRLIIILSDLRNEINSYMNSISYISDIFQDDETTQWLKPKEERVNIFTGL